MDYALFLYQAHNPLIYPASPALPSVTGVGTDATQAIFAN